MFCMEDLTKQLGKRIKQIRKESNYTQADFAEKINVDFKYLSRIETGLSTPSLKTIEKIAEQLGVDYRILFTFDKPLDKKMLEVEICNKIKKFSPEKLKKLLEIINILEYEF